jgi:DNA-binding transcriptional ArsR family regulator
MHIADPFAAISDPNRRVLLETLRRGPATVNAMALALPEISRPAVSQHLRALLDAGLVTVRPEGTKRIYALKPTGFDSLNLWLDQFWSS